MPFHKRFLKRPRLIEGGKAIVGGATKRIALQTGSLQDRKLLRTARDNLIGEPIQQKERASFQKLLRLGLLKQVDVFPPRFTITDRGLTVLESLERKTKLQGVTTIIDATEAKALRQLSTGAMPSPRNKAERAVLEKLKRKKLVRFTPEVKPTPAIKAVRGRKATKTKPAIQSVRGKSTTPGKPAMFSVTAEGRIVLRQHAQQD